MTTLGYKHTDESKRKISESMTGKVFKPRQKKYTWTESHKANFMKSRYPERDHTQDVTDDSSKDT